MKKKILCICLIIMTVLLCSCKKESTDIKAVDFGEYTIEEVIAWANENDAAPLFGFVYSTDSEKAYGTVISQSVEPGKSITDGIEITVSTKPRLTDGSDTAVVPNVIGQDISSAREKISSLGFTIDTKYENSSKEKDIVLFSDPLPGIKAKTNSVITLTLSSGKAKESTVSIILDFDGLSEEDHTIKVYVDGELDRSKTVCLDSSVTRKTFKFSGSGKKEIKFKINNEVFAVYDVDFGTSEINKIG